jgi:hypothetical protein
LKLNVQIAQRPSAVAPHRNSSYYYFSGIQLIFNKRSCLHGLWLPTTVASLEDIITTIIIIAMNSSSSSTQQQEAHEEQPSILVYNMSGQPPRSVDVTRALVVMIVDQDNNDDDDKQSKSNKKNTILQECAFQYCTSLKEVQFNPVLKLQTIGTRAFDDCTALTTISGLPDTLQTLEDSCFAWCRSLQHVHLNQGLLYIGNSAFEHAGLTSLVVPSTVKTIGDRAFLRCHLLTTLDP